MAEKTREELMSEQIGKNINCFNFDNKKFVENFSREHRTLQQQFTSLCLAWINYVGSPEYRFDGRNQYSHQQCEKLNQFMKENEMVSWMPII
jgi:hypothetical protein